MKHPFEPFILKDSKNLIIGTLPPENISYYYSNSSNTRMWDILKSILDNTEEIPKNSYKELSVEEKKDILKKLNLSMCDIIYEYDRKKESTKDNDIIPIKYLDINSLIEDTSIENLLFVYKSAAKWFLHSLENKKPIKSPKPKINIHGEFYNYKLHNKIIKCILLPNPLNRGKKGETLPIKRDIYKKWIL